jgi:FKBP-type peptidyl-prolyl cis-trans isomerase SlyD
MTVNKIAQDVVVSLHYKLTLDDGSVADESEADEPLEYLHGYGNIVPGLERELEGMGITESRKVTVEPADAYGEIEPDGEIEVDREAFPSDMHPEEGMPIQIEDEHGDLQVAFIKEVVGDTVILDLNHPLAGERLHFEVTVTGLRAATSEELLHGHVHGAHGHHH